MLWFDTIIFLLTFFKAIQMRREMSGGLLEILFRDGASIMRLTRKTELNITATGTIYYGCVSSAVAM